MMSSDIQMLVRELEEACLQLGRERMLNEQLATKNLKLQNELATLESNVKAEITKDMEAQVSHLVGVCLCDNRNKIAQIKAVRKVTGWDLMRAKQAVQNGWSYAGQDWDVSCVDR